MEAFSYFNFYFCVYVFVSHSHSHLYCSAVPAVHCFGDSSCCLALRKTKCTNVSLHTKRHSPFPFLTSQSLCVLSTYCILFGGFIPKRIWVSIKKIFVVSREMNQINKCHVCIYWLSTFWCKAMPNYILAPCNAKYSRNWKGAFQSEVLYLHSI